ncbi:MAG: hypothetical protein AB7E85_02430 [Pseudobdellovibrionaceae bacterium]
MVQQAPQTQTGAKAQAGIQKFQKMPEDTPVLPSLYKTMPVELVVNGGRSAAIFHKTPLPESIWWAEYDMDLKSMYFVTVTGKIIGLGFPITPVLHSKLYQAKVVNFVFVTEENMPITPYTVPLIIRYTSDGNIEEV